MDEIDSRKVVDLYAGGWGFDATAQVSQFLRLVNYQ